MMVDEVITLFNYYLSVNVAITQVMKLNNHTIAIIAVSLLFHFSSVFHYVFLIDFFLLLCVS